MAARDFALSFSTARPQFARDQRSHGSKRAAAAAGLMRTHFSNTQLDVAHVKSHNQISEVIYAGLPVCLTRHCNPIFAAPVALHAGGGFVVVLWRPRLSSPNVDSGRIACCLGRYPDEIRLCL